MNKKGFTLIELLSTIAIMGLIATMTSINVINILQNKKEINTQNKNSLISTAACVYIELEKNASLKETCLTSSCNISTDILIEEGLLAEDVVTEPKIVQIYKENNHKICVVKDDKNG